MSLLLEIVTPEKVVFNDKADSVVLPTTEGDVGVLSGHIPLLIALAPGELKVITEGKTEYLTMDKGFAQVLGDKVSDDRFQLFNFSGIYLLFLRFGERFFRSQLRFLNSREIYLFNIDSTLG